MARSVGIDCGHIPRVVYFATTFSSGQVAKKRVVRRGLAEVLADGHQCIPDSGKDRACERKVNVSSRRRPDIVYGTFHDPLPHESNQHRSDHRRDHVPPIASATPFDVVREKVPDCDTTPCDREIAL